jgi:hypothetical protein
MVSNRNRYRCLLSSECAISILKTCEFLQTIVTSFWTADYFPFRHWKFWEHTSEIQFHSSSNKLQLAVLREMIETLPDSIVLCTNSVWVFQKFNEVVRMTTQEDLQLNFNQFQTIHREVLLQRYDSEIKNKWLHP